MLPREGGYTSKAAVQGLSGNSEVTFVFSPSL
jgi:hypothetical protein